MNENLDAERARALTPYGSGAVVTTSYLERRQEYVAVNRNDLEDLKAFDGMEATLFSFGSFFASGSAWLGVDKYFTDARMFANPLLLVCLISFVFGVVLCFAGLTMRLRKKRRIDRIFAETKTAS